MDYNSLNTVLVDVVRDIEKKCKTVHCYAYPKTIRSILTAAEKSPIAPHFKDKYYYGMFNYLSLTKLEETLVNLCHEGKLSYIIYKDKKRFSCLIEEDEENKEEHIIKKGLSESDYEEISSLLDSLI